MEKQISNRAYKNARKSIQRYFRENCWKPSFTFKSHKDFLGDYGEIRRVDDICVDIYQGGGLIDIHPGTYDANLVDVLRSSYLKYENIRYVVISYEITELVPSYTYDWGGHKEYCEDEIILGYEIIAYEVSNEEIAKLLGTV